MNKEKFLEIADVLDRVKPSSFHMSNWFSEYIEAEDHDYFETLTDYYDENDRIPSALNNPVIALKNGGIDKNSIYLSCGTAACVAGWVLVNEYFNGNKEPLEWCMENGTPNYQYKAREILGITIDQAMRLFFCDELSVWNRLRDEYDFDFDPDMQETWNINPKHAAEVLRKIANGEIKINDEDLDSDY